MSDAVVTTKFKKGMSGNPRGRPKGSKNKSTILREAMESKTDRMLSREVPKVLKVVIDAAIKGDMSAAKMILDRAVPVIKAGDGNESALGGGINITIKNLTADHGKTETVIEGEVIDG
jgi:hypothetical protein